MFLVFKTVFNGRCNGDQSVVRTVPFPSKQGCILSIGFLCPSDQASSEASRSTCAKRSDEIFMIDPSLMTVGPASGGRSPGRSVAVWRVKEWEFPLAQLVVSSSHGAL